MLLLLAVLDLRRRDENKLAILPPVMVVAPLVGVVVVVVVDDDDDGGAGGPRAITRPAKSLPMTRPVLPRGWVVYSASTGLRAMALTAMRSSLGPGLGIGRVVVVAVRFGASRMSAFIVDDVEVMLLGK